MYFLRPSCLLSSNIVSHLRSSLFYFLRKKVNLFQLSRYIGLQLGTAFVYRTSQSPGWHVTNMINPTIGFHYFPSGPRLHSQPQRFNTVWRPTVSLVWPAWQHRHMCICVCKQPANVVTLRDSRESNLRPNIYYICCDLQIDSPTR